MVITSLGKRSLVAFYALNFEKANGGSGHIGFDLLLPFARLYVRWSQFRVCVITVEECMAGF